MYYLIIALQVFCVYHVFKNKNDYYWVFLIVFLPAIGCAIYLITQVYNKRDAEKIQENITTIINPTKKLRDLENKLQFSETYQNRVDLADAYFELNDFKNAIAQYRSALEDASQNDFHVTKQLITSFYQTQDYDQVILYAEKVLFHPEFKRSQTQFLYGLALQEKGRSDEAELQLAQIDQPYSNYKERLTYVKLLLNSGKTQKAKDILNELYSETQNMTKMNRRKFRSTSIEIESLRNSL